MLTRANQTAWLALLLGTGIAAPAAFAAPAAPAAPAASSSQFAQRSVTIGTVTYRLDDNWVFINTKCNESDKDCQKRASDFLAKYQDSEGNDYKFLNNQNWLQCLSNCPGGSSSSGVDLDHCMTTPSCIKGIEGTLAAAQSQAAKSADPKTAPENGIAAGDKEAEAFRNSQITITTTESAPRSGPNGPGINRGPSKSTTSPPPGQEKDAGGLVVSQGGPLGGGGPPNPWDSSNPSNDTAGPGGDRDRPGGAQDDPSLGYARGFSGNPNSQMSRTIDAIVKASTFLNGQEKFYVDQNLTPTNLNALGGVSSDILNPIAQQVTGDQTSGRTAFDGLPTNLKKEVKRKCSTNFFGQKDCQQ